MIREIKRGMLKARCTDIEKCTTDGGREMKFIERGTKRVKQPWHHFVEDSVNVLKNNVYFPIVEVLYKSFLVYINLIGFLNSVVFVLYT